MARRTSAESTGNGKLSDVKLATVTVPAAYLEDARAALAAEIRSVSNVVAVSQGAVLSAQPENIETRVQDRDGAIRILMSDVEAFGHLAGAAGDVQLTADAGNTLWYLLEAMTRLLTKRLRREMRYGPVDMGAVLEIAERLRWAATEAARLPS